MILEPPAHAGEDVQPEFPEPEQKSGWGGNFHRFFIIPGVVLLFCVFFFYIFRAGKRETSVPALLETIQEGHRSVRWQAAVELSKRLAHAELVPQDPEFSETMLRLFRSDLVYKEDPRIRLFLALAMGRTGKAEFYAPIAEALGSATRVDERSVYIRALGFLRDERAVPILHPFLNEDDVVIRHETVQALGSIGSAESLSHLQGMLDEAEPNVKWDAAVALAKLGDASGKDILLDLMDRAYYDGFPDVRPEGRAWAMEVAIRAAAELNDPDLNARIKELSDTDPNIKVRGVSLELVKQLGL